MMRYVADFESTTNPDDCRVWAWAVCDIDNADDVTLGTTFEEFMEWCQIQPFNPTVYFCNLKWDSQFLIYWLFHNGFKHVTSKERADSTFTTTISNKGLYYQIEVIFLLKGKSVKKVTFLDSMKLLPMGVEEIAKTFELPFKKLKIDYDAHNDKPIGAPLTPAEEEYIIHDVKIVAYGLKFFFEQGLNRITIGSCALHEYRTIVTKKRFKMLFPNSTRYHKDIQQSYRGGYTYVNPVIAGKTVGKGFVLDVNSIYPFVLYERLLPWGTPIFFKGKYEDDEIYPLYTQMIRCQFDLKPGKLPTIQIKNSLYYSGTTYLTTSDDSEMTLVLNSVDLKLFLEHYDVENLEYISGWKFRGTTGLFREYIDKWNDVKVQARLDNNPGLVLIAKLFLNSLGGKFGTDTKVRSKIPYLADDDVVRYKDTPPEDREGIYIPIATFMTSYAREIIIGAAQKIMDDYESGKSNIQFLYCDTDSLHCSCEDDSLPEGLEIDKTKLGAFKFESKFKKARFLRAKCYIEDSTEDVYNDNPEYKLKVTVAGMPKSCKEQVDFDNFKIGATYTGKKQPKAVKGGVILQDIDFTIKR